jgi:hypothetical protein
MESFEKYINLIRSFAWRFSKNYSVSFDDCYQECCLVFLSCQRKYDPAKSKFSTYLSHQLRALQGLHSFLNKEIHWENINYPLELFEEVLESREYPISIFQNDWVSKDAKDLFKIISIFSIGIRDIQQLYYQIKKKAKDFDWPILRFRLALDELRMVYENFY